MRFTHFSTLLLLASTVAAIPRYHQKGKWEHFRSLSSFASLDDVSAGYTIPSRIAVALVIPQGTVLATPPTALVSHVLSVSSTESGGDDTGKEGSKLEMNPGLPSSSELANAVSSTSVAAASSPAPTTPAFSTSGVGVSYSATFTEYVLLYFGHYLFPRSHPLLSDPTPSYRPSH